MLFVFSIDSNLDNDIRINDLNYNLNLTFIISICVKVNFCFQQFN